MTQLLTNEFIKKYESFPEHMNELGKFVYYRTYSRYLPEQGRRETWKETVRRAVEFNVGLARKHMTRQGFRGQLPELRKEAEKLFDNIYNLRQALSGRTFWVGGAETGVGDKYPLANFNCAYLTIETWDDFGDLFYCLMVGTGVGVKATKESTAALPPIRNDVEIIHEPYTKRFPLVQVADTEKFVINRGEKVVIHIGDSKEGWVDAIRIFFDVLTNPAYASVKQIGLHYDYIRPKGTPLKTFGGTASGHEPLRDMFIGIERVLHNRIDNFLQPLEEVAPGYVQVRPIHILDIANLIGANVVVGGVRRTAEIFLFDADDFESMFAKYGINGIWNEEKHRHVINLLRKAGHYGMADNLAGLPLFDDNARPLHHRRMSNNSIAFTDKPDPEALELVFAMLQGEGEPGFVNLREMARRRLLGQGITNPSDELIKETMKTLGMNPCAEIILDSKGVCNLTTVNAAAFVKDGVLDLEGLKEAQRLSARAGLRMTLATLELPEWDKTQQRDRLIGTSLTGWQDALAMTTHIESDVRRGEMHDRLARVLLTTLQREAHKAAEQYARELRVAAPLLDTTIKPEGTISQVFGGVSNGVHFSHAPYYIRRIRINAHDPLAAAMEAMGYELKPEVGQTMEDARTKVLEFPVASGATKTKDDVYAKEQLDIYFEFQNYYTAHNSSNTIHVRPDEWDYVRDRIFDEWENFCAVSFLSYDGGSYELAPYETITEEEYEEMARKLPTFDPERIREFEKGVDFEIDEDCAGGACAVR
jgi:ribonucleoside-triphosphate reductase